MFQRTLATLINLLLHYCAILTCDSKLKLGQNKLNGRSAPETSNKISDKKSNQLLYLHREGEI